MGRPYDHRGRRSWDIYHRAVRQKCTKWAQCRVGPEAARLPARRSAPGCGAKSTRDRRQMMAPSTLWMQPTQTRSPPQLLLPQKRVQSSRGLWQRQGMPPAGSSWAMKSAVRRQKVAHSRAWSAATTCARGTAHEAHAWRLISCATQVASEAISSQSLDLQAWPCAPSADN
jgi:hypothetical protein